MQRRENLSAGYAYFPFGKNSYVEKSVRVLCFNGRACGSEDVYDGLGRRKKISSNNKKREGMRAFAFVR